MVSIFNHYKAWLNNWVKYRTGSLCCDQVNILDQTLFMNFFPRIATVTEVNVAKLLGLSICLSISKLVVPPTLTKVSRQHVKWEKLKNLRQKYDRKLWVDWQLSVCLYCCSSLVHDFKQWPLFVHGAFIGDVIYFLVAIATILSTASQGL